MTARQGFGSAFSAEMRRVVFKPKTLIAAAIFATTAVLVFVGMTAIIDWGNAVAESNDFEGMSAAMSATVFPAFIGFDLPLSVVSFCFGIYASAFVARDYNDGTIMATLLAVPNRRRLFAARLLPWTLLTTVFSLLAFAIVGAIGIGRAGVGQVATIVCQGLLATVASVLTTIVGFCCGSTTKRGSLSVFLFLALFFLVPTVVGMVDGFGPDLLQTIARSVRYAMPGNAFGALIELVPLDKATDVTWISLGVSIAWSVGAPVLSYALFKTRATLGR